MNSHQQCFLDGGHQSQKHQPLELMGRNTRLLCLSCQRSRFILFTEYIMSYAGHTNKENFTVQMLCVDNVVVFIDTGSHQTKQVWVSCHSLGKQQFWTQTKRGFTLWTQVTFFIRVALFYKILMPVLHFLHKSCSVSFPQGFQQQIHKPYFSTIQLLVQTLLPKCLPSILILRPTQSPSKYFFTQSISHLSPCFLFQPTYLHRNSCSVDIYIQIT